MLKRTQKKNGKVRIMIKPLFSLKLNKCSVTFINSSSLAEC